MFTLYCGGWRAGLGWTALAIVLSRAITLTAALSLVLVAISAAPGSWRRDSTSVAVLSLGSAASSLIAPLRRPPGGGKFYFSFYADLSMVVAARMQPQHDVSMHLK